MTINFATFKYDMVKVYVLKIRDNDPYIDPESNSIIT